MRSLRILIIEDNPDLAENIAEYFEIQGHLLDFAMDGIGGIHLAVTEEYDVIILDIMLPGMDGYTVCRKLREANGNRVPVLMLTARDTLSEKLEGFDAGADDYLVKPFELEELNARIHALVRRVEELGQPPLKVADLEIDLGKVQVRRENHSIHLNRTGLKILTLLAKASPNVVPRKTIENELWRDMPPDSDALKSHIYSLRQAIDKPFKNALIHTVYGIGYKLVDPDDI